MCRNIERSATKTSPARPRSRLAVGRRFDDAATCKTVSDSLDAAAVEMATLN